MLARKGDKESSSGGLNGEKKTKWPGQEARKWYILIGLSIIISILLFPNILTRPRDYKLGDVADVSIKASHEFLIENHELTAQKRHDAVRSIPSVYDFDPTATDVMSRIKEAFNEGRLYLAESLSAVQTPADVLLGENRDPGAQKLSLEVLKERFFEILDISSEKESFFDVLLKSGFPSEVEEAAIDLLNGVFEKGVVGSKTMLMSQSGKGIVLHNIYTEKEIEVTDLDRFYDVKAARDSIRDRQKYIRSMVSPQKLADVSMELAVALIKPNATFNKRETELRKDLARKSVKPFYFKVKKGEMLVREGERITPEHLLKLSEQNKFLKQKEMTGQVPAMVVLIGFLISAMYFVGLMKGPSSRSPREEVKDLFFNAMTLLVMFLVIVALNFVFEETARGFNYFTARALVFAIPVASGAMLVSVFQGMAVATSFSLVISVLASLVVEGQVEFFAYFFIGSILAAYGVRNCRDRSILIKTGLKVGVCNAILALSIEALHGSFYSVEALIALASAFIGGAIVGVIATGMLPLIEMSFGYTTDIKLLELANLDRPLLRELMVQCPGTHHHSVIVSNMVEATAEAVNANPLLAKVAAYYHDIGKMKKPLYFVENQRNRENKHERLAPSMSSLILISHVKDGVELAKKYKLGKEIIDIIRQHHGTSLISFFYEKAKEQCEKKGKRSFQVKEEDFRYPGPKPQTKEAGLVMLADAVEAASRTLVDPNAARIQGMVQKIINRVFSDGQLDECELTLKDLHEIAKSFNKTLSGIFHHRVEYPESAAKSVTAKKGENGNTDQLSAGDSRPKKLDEQAEAGKGLKRLGLS